MKCYALYNEYENENVSHFKTRLVIFVFIFTLEECIIMTLLSPSVQIMVSCHDLPQVGVCTWCVRVHSAGLTGAGSVVWSGTGNVWETTGSDEDLFGYALKLREWNQWETLQDTVKSLSLL